MSAIPVSFLLSVTPSVISAGAESLGMNAVMLTSSTSVPIGTLQGFGNAAEVTAFFGPTAEESILAGIYFAGFNGASRAPSALYFAQYNTSAVAGYLRGANLGSLTLSQLEALSGTLSLSVNGTLYTTSTINLSSAGSFSGAAALIQTALQAQLAGITCTYSSQLNAFTITSPTTGASSSVGFATAGTLANGLSLTAALGAVTSPGAIAAVPSGLMTGITSVSQDWATFMTVFDPDSGAAGGPIKQLFAQWNGTQNGNYMYVAWDTDPTPSTTLPDAACFAAQVAGLSGTFPVWDGVAAQAPKVAAFVCGLTASIAFNSPGGRTAYSYRSSPALTPLITSPTVFANVTGTPETPGNGYNCYAAFGSRTATFNWLQLGSVTGAFDWADSYVNQIYWNSQFQNDFATYQSNVKSTPYTPAGYGGIHQALASDIQAMGAFGAWQANVELSQAEQVAANDDAGITIGPILESQGWYLLVEDPGSSVRAARGSPICKFYYADGGSVVSINMGSVDVQ